MVLVHTITKAISTVVPLPMVATVPPLASSVSVCMTVAEQDAEDAELDNEDDDGVHELDPDQHADTTMSQFIDQDVDPDGSQDSDLE